MESNQTKVIVFENFNINELKEEDTENLGIAIVDYLNEINDIADKNKKLPVNTFGKFIVEAEIDKSIIPNEHYKGIIIKIKTRYE